MERYFEKYFNGEESFDLKWDYILTIPEIKDLNGCKQSEKWHMEGDAFDHTKQCLKQAYKNISTISEFNDIETLNHKRILIMSVLLHDIGKPKTTFFKNNVWHSYNHEIEGEKIARKILFDENVIAREKVCTLIRWHMEAYYLLKKKDIITNIAKLSFNLNISDLVFVHLCDIKGSKNADVKNTEEALKNVKMLQLISSNMSCYNKPFLSTCKTSQDLYIAKHLVYNNKNLIDCKISDKNLIRVHVMIGLPGAGKDSFIKEYLSNVTVISRDEIRIRLGYCTNNEKAVLDNVKEEEITKIFNSELLETVKNGNDVIINNINLKKKYRLQYHEILKKYNVVWIYHYIQAPLLEDNFKRREEYIEKELFYNMINSIEWPKPEEFDFIDVNREVNDNGKICFKYSRFIE